MSKIQIKEASYNSILKDLSRIAEVTSRHEGNQKKKYKFSQNPPTIPELVAHGITEDGFAESCTREILEWLMYYAEQDPDTEEYFFTPDPKRLDAKEFEKTRKYISSILIHCVEITD